MNIFETRTMLEALKLGKPAHSFLRDRYFSNVRTFDTTKLDIDIVKGKRKVAPFVHPKIGGKTVERDGYTTNSYEAPEVSPDMVTTAEDLVKRAPGQTVYGSDPNARAAQQLGEDLAELDNMITRREEVMCAEALFTGQINVKGDGYDEVLRYWPTNPAEQPYEALSGGALWSAASTAAPTADLRAARRKIIQESGVTPQDVIMGTNALEAFLKLLEGQNVGLNFRRVDMGQINPSHLPNGVTYWGYLKDSALDIWTYDEWYLDDSGVEHPMVPAKNILIGSSNVRTTMAYGMVTLMRGSDDNAAPEFFAERRVPDSWTQRKNPAGRIVQVKSRPLPIIHQINGFRVLKVLA